MEQTIHHNLSTSELYSYGIRNEGLEISSTGALLSYSGKITGRSPSNKRIVKDKTTKDIWWEGSPCIPIEKKLFDHYKKESTNIINNLSTLFIVDAFAGWDLENRLKIRIYCSSSYHALFLKNMLIQSEYYFSDDEIDFTIYNTGFTNLSSIDVPIKIKDNTLSDILVAIDFTSMEMVIFGTMYAGEMKKGILTLMMFLMPQKENLCLHSSANTDKNKRNLTIFMGLSGTGKTTLSSDENRLLIGDDEHVWTNNGIFNVEGGCYAKCINLDKNAEPEIYGAIKYGSVLENVVTLTNRNIVDFTDTSITQNTRCSYPLGHIQNSIIPATIKEHPTNIIMLTCDASGLLPPVAKLDKESALLFFVNGFTSKIAGTEQGITEPVPTFSSCFGEPFLVWNPTVYGNLLKEKINKWNPNVWLLNTGWVNGGYKTGRRISIKNTKNILNSIHDGTLIKQQFIKYPVFNFEIPMNCPNVDRNILDPRLSRSPRESEKSYLDKLSDLKDKFEKNMKNKSFHL